MLTIIQRPLPLSAGQSLFAARRVDVAQAAAFWTQGETRSRGVPMPAGKMPAPDKAYVIVFQTVAAKVRLMVTGSWCGRRPLGDADLKLRLGSLIVSGAALPPSFSLAKRREWRLLRDRPGTTPGHTPMSKPLAEADMFRRVEVISGSGRRRRWPETIKAGIVAEALEEGAVVSEIAKVAENQARLAHASPYS